MFDPVADLTIDSFIGDPASSPAEDASMREGSASLIPHPGPSDAAVVPAMPPQVRKQVRSASSTPTMKSGRVSNADRKILKDGFEKINAACAQLAIDTGFTEERVISLWNKDCGRSTKGFNYWNVYESYLAANLTDELIRSGFEIPAGIKWDEVSHKQRRMCYASFQQAYPDDAWEEILRVFNLSRGCERSVGTFAKRTSDFQKMTSQLIHLVSPSAAKHNNMLTLYLDRHVAS
jgi:hypothetical protein